jgi:hypothetical protein
MAEEQLKLVAVAEDRASNPLAKIKQSLNELGQQGQLKGLRGDITSLHGDMHRLQHLMQGGLSPAMRGGIVVAVALAATLHELSKEVNKVAEARRTLNDLEVATGLSARTIRDFQNTLKPFGINAEQAGDALVGMRRKFIEFQKGLSHDAPGVEQALIMSIGRDKGETLYRELRRNWRNPQKQEELVMQAMESTKDLGQRLALGAVFGISETIARHMEGPAYQRMKAAAAKFGHVEIPTEAQEKYFAAWTRAEQSIENFRTALYGRLIPAATDVSNKIADLYEKLTEWAEHPRKAIHDLWEEMKNINFNMDAARAAAPLPGETEEQRKKRVESVGKSVHSSSLPPGTIPPMSEQQRELYRELHRSWPALQRDEQERAIEKGTEKGSETGSKKGVLDAFKELLHLQNYTPRAGTAPEMPKQASYHPGEAPFGTAPEGAPREGGAARAYGGGGRFGGRIFAPSGGQPIELPPTGTPSPVAIPPMGQAPIGGIGTLAGSRAAFARELEANPRLRERLFASTQAEVGGQGPQATQAYLESVMNRASARGKTLEQTINDARYYPHSTIAKLNRKISGKARAGMESALTDVLGGSNISNFATGNESGRVRSGGAEITFNPRTGERFVAENADRAWVNRQRAMAAGPAVAGRRPYHYGGALHMGDKDYTFGTGGGGRGSMPYGDWPITPGAEGPWGRAHGAIGLNQNQMNDPLLGNMRRGIEIHSSSGETVDRILTSGCLGIPKSQWPAFKRNLRQQIEQHGPMRLSIGPGGAAIVPLGDKTVAMGQSIGKGPKVGDFDFPRGKFDDHLSSQTNAMNRLSKMDLKGNAHLRVDVAAPKGTRARSLRYGGLIKSIQLNRSAPQMLESQDYESPQK